MVACMSHVKGLLDLSAVVLTAQNSGAPPIVQPAVICGQSIDFLCAAVKKYNDPLITLLCLITAERHAFAAAVPRYDPMEGQNQRMLPGKAG